MKILYIHHCGVFGGASKSLLENIKILQNKYGVVPTIITPKGTTSDIFLEFVSDVHIVKGVSQFDHTIVGYYRKFRWLVLIREFFYILPTILILLKLKSQKYDFDIIHINDTTSIFPAFLAKIIFKKPCIMHARTVLTESGSLRRKIFGNFFKNNINTVIAIDENVKDSLPYIENCKVIHNGLSMDGFSNIEENRVVVDKIIVGFFGNFLSQKGIFEFVQSAKMCKDKNLNIEFYIVGHKSSSKTFLSKVLTFLKIKEDMVELIDEYINVNNLDNIKFIPFQKDIRGIMSQINILCFPSKMAGIGRPVFEAAFFKKPSIVALQTPKDDTFINYKSGIAIENGSSEELFNAYNYFLDNKEQIQIMGNFAFDFANNNFDINKNTLELYKLYVDINNKNV